jgi:isopentenyl diphosphate isomerase/L-lactate dehydrogenase-like FMN-dependent dehydrogenase
VKHSHAQAGVSRAITLLREKVSRNLAMLGVSRVSDLTPNCLISSRAVQDDHLKFS